MSLAGLLAECFESVCALPFGYRPGFQRQLGRAVLRAQVPPNPADVLISKCVHAVLG